MQVAIESVSIRCSDEQVLSGTFYRLPSTGIPAYVVVIFPGVGIPAGYYQNLAQWFACAGRPTLTFDYRGIGGSRSTVSRKNDVSFRQWGSKDCAGALGVARSAYPGAPIVGIAHSFGSFLIGLAEGAQNLLSAAVMLGPHTGFPDDYSRRVRPIMKIAWHTVMPMVTRLLGYFPGRLTGLPSDLPRYIALQWAQRFQPDIWGELREYVVAPDGNYDDLRLRMEALCIPILGVRASDDAFSTDAAARRLLGCYQNSPTALICIEPRFHEVRRLGHMRYLSSRIASTWSRMDQWIAQNVSAGGVSIPIVATKPGPVSRP